MNARRVIEHVFGQLSGKLRKVIITEREKLSDAPAVAAWLQQQFEQLQPSSIAADANGLPALYKWIVANDGAWSPRRMR